MDPKRAERYVGEGPMELKTFIAETLQQICAGIKEAHQRMGATP